MRTYTIGLLLIAVLTSCKSYKGMNQQNRVDIDSIHKANVDLNTDYSVVEKRNKILQSRIDSLQTKYEVLENRNSKLDQEIIELKTLTDKELVQVCGLFINYLNSIYNISQKYPPPCTNAANGWFRDEIVQPPTTALANAKIENLRTADAKKLMMIFTYFAQNNQNAFIFNTNAEDKVYFKKMLADAIRIYNLYSLLGEDIARLFISEGTDLDAWKKTKTDSENLISQLKVNANVCRRGFHANGWIADWTNAVANKSLELTNSNVFYSNTSKAQKIKVLLTTFFTNVSKMQTNSQCKDCPFLPAEWQIGYALIFKSASEKLSQISNE